MKRINKMDLCKIVSFVSFVMASIIVSLSFNSCCEDNKTVIEDNSKYNTNTTVIRAFPDAGVFTLMNLTTNEEITEDEAFVNDKDLLQIIFTPKDEYKDFSFQEKYMKDNIQVESKFETKPDGSEEKISMLAIYEKEVDGVVYQYSAKREVVLRTTNTRSYIHCVLGMTPDLLQFVTPEFSYTDNMGEGELKVLVHDDMWTLDENLDIPELGEWMSWNKDVRFYQWGIDCSMSVNYLPKSNTELGKDEYDFHQSIAASSANSHGTFINGSGGITMVNKNYSWFDLTINILIGEDLKNEDKRIPKEKVQEYIDRLVANPQTIKFHIDQEGTISRITDDNPSE